MEIYASVIQQVIINPKVVIEKLITDSIGDGSWVFENNGKYYRGFEQFAGCHSWDDKEEIDKEKYDYIKALELVLNNIIKSP